jgi:hypothetical protein
MKKLFLGLLALVIIGGVVFFACKKEDSNIAEKQETSAIKQQKKPTNPQLLAAVAAIGVKLEAGKTYTIQYRTGFYYRTEISVLFGVYSYVKTGCTPGDGICDIVHVWEKGGRLIFAPPVIEKDENGLASLTKISEPQDGCFEGYLCVIPKGVVSDKKTLVFLTDINKTIYPERYTSDVFHLNHPFAIEPVLCYDAGIRPEYQIVPAGDYTLYKEGNLRFWYIEIE